MQFCCGKCLFMTDVVQQRKGFESLGLLYPAAQDIVQEYVSIAGVDCYWFYEAGKQQPADFLVYVHGGAFMFGSVRSHGPLVSYLAQRTGRRILFIEYRLAPEHPFPAGIDDVVRVIQSLEADQTGFRYGIIGDSAGGNLTMAVQLQLRQLQLPLPAFSVVISPWADLECKHESFRLKKDLDPILSKPYLLECAQLYAGERPLTDPLVSPVNASFEGLGPVLILCGTYEILEGDSLVLYERLFSSGVAARLELFKGAVHVWPQQDIYSDHAQTALDMIAEFIAASGA
jgi:acetyl esterase/lipase